MARHRRLNVHEKQDKLHGVQNTKRKGSGRPRKHHGRPRGAKNNPRTYTNAQLHECLNMDIDRDRNSVTHQYKSRRQLARAFGIPESTIRDLRRKIAKHIPIKGKLLGVTGQRHLTDTEEIILLNLIHDSQERGVCVTRINIKQMLMDFLYY